MKALCIDNSCGVAVGMGKFTVGRWYDVTDTFTNSSVYFWIISDDVNCEAVVFKSSFKTLGQFRNERLVEIFGGN